jgi:plastocyanin
MVRRWSCAAAAVLAAGVVPTAAGGESCTPDGQTVCFSFDGAATDYEPAELVTTPGATVTFRGSFAQHPLIWQLGDQPSTSSGTSRSLTFPIRGTFPFACSIHDSMRGRIVIPGNRTQPPTFTVAPSDPEPGEVVTFRLDDGPQDPDPGGGIKAVQWDFDDGAGFGALRTSRSITHVFERSGTYALRVRTRDNGNDFSEPATLALRVARRGAGTPDPDPGTGDPGPGDPGPGTGGGTRGGDGDGGGGRGVVVDTDPGTPGIQPPAVPQPGSGAIPDTRRPSLGRLPRVLPVRLGHPVLELRVDEPAALVAELRRGGRRLARGVLPRGPGRRTLRLEPQPALRRLLRAADRPRARLDVTAIDAAGNVTRLRVTVTLRRVARGAR